MAAVMVVVAWEEVLVLSRAEVREAPRLAAGECLPCLALFQLLLDDYQRERALLRNPSK